MDCNPGKGSPPLRNFPDHLKQTPISPKNAEHEELNPLSDIRSDRTNTFVSETVPIPPANNCAQPVSSWPAQVTITPIAPYNLGSQPPTYTSKLFLHTPPPAPTVVPVTPKENVDANPSGLFGNQALTMGCQPLPSNPVNRSDFMPNSQVSVIQPLCYGPVSEGHYLLLQPVCCEYEISRNIKKS